MKILFLPGSFTSPAARFRIWQFAEPLRDLGHEVKVQVVCPDRGYAVPNFPGFLHLPAMAMVAALRLLSATRILCQAKRFDVVVMNRDLIPEVRITAIEPLLARINPRLVFDLDDAIYLGARDRKLRRILPYFRAVVAGNEELAHYLRQHNSNVQVIPTVVDGRHYTPTPSRCSGPIRIGWSGSAGPLHAHLPLVREVIVELARHYGFEFVVISNQRPRFDDWHGVQTRFIEWNQETEVEDLWQFDIGLMPLPNGPFERGKCPTKLVQYMGIGIPTVASAVGMNPQVIEHGRTGYCCSTAGEWVNSLARLIQDPAARRRMGTAGRLRFEKTYSLQAALSAWLDVMEQVASERAVSSPVKRRGHATAVTGGPLST
jgi:glycosyltransferase involved in cell wall biosynthesis